MQCKVEKLTRAQKAVAIAKDVCKRLKMQKLNVKRANGYVRRKNGFRLTLEKSLQEQIDTVESQCQVCALGGMFLSYVRLFNNVDITYDMNGFHSLVDKLGKVFTHKTLALIEGVFERRIVNGECISNRFLKYIDSDVEEEYECRVRSYHDNIVEDAKKKTNCVLSKKEKTEAVLLAICKNIIRNNGKFILPD